LQGHCIDFGYITALHWSIYIYIKKCWSYSQPYEYVKQENKEKVHEFEAKMD